MILPAGSSDRCGSGQLGERWSPVVLKALIRGLVPGNPQFVSFPGCIQPSAVKGGHKNAGGVVSDSVFVTGIAVLWKPSIL